jgi:TolB protein
MTAKRPPSAVPPALKVVRTIVLVLIAMMLVLLGIYAAPALMARFTAHPNPGASLQPTGVPATLTPSITPSATQSPPTAALAQGSTPESLYQVPSLAEGLIVVALNESGYTHLFAYQPGEMPLLRLTNGLWDDITPAVNPQGTAIAFASNREGHWDLYLLSLADGTVERLTDSPEFDSSPTFSPDGLWMAFESLVPDENGGNLEIFIRPVDGSQAPIRLTEDAGADFSPAWSPQGRKIVFVSTRGGENDIWLADLDQVEDRFMNISRDQSSSDTHPAWSPDGTRLSWSSAERDGIQSIRIWKMDQPNDQARPLSSGTWSAWNPGGEALLVSMNQPNRTYLTGYSLNDASLTLPMVGLSGSLWGLNWGRGKLPGVLPPALAEAARLTPTPDWEPVLAPGANLPQSRRQMTILDNVQAPYPMLQDGVDEAFYALKKRVVEEAGWDFLVSLEECFVPLTSPLNPGMAEDWLYTGRAFRFSTAPMQAGWVILGREDFGGLTYWRVYLRSRFQDGTHGMPLKILPWDLEARFSGDPLAYEEGGARLPVIPPGYWIDFTELARDYGWERVASLPTWRVAYSSVRYNEFVQRDSLDWLSAMLEIYPKAALDTPTPVSSPTSTPTPTDTPTSTPTPTRTPYRSPTPTPTWTRRPTSTITPTSTRRPTRTLRPTNTPWPTRTSPPTNTPRWTEALPPTFTLAAPIVQAPTPVPTVTSPLTTTMTLWMPTAISAETYVGNFRSESPYPTFSPLVWTACDPLTRTSFAALEPYLFWLFCWS